MFIHFWQHIGWWLEVHLGIVNEPGPWYGFTSGSGSDIGELALIGGAWTLWRRHNCHTRGCIRIGRHPVEGTPWVTCRKCHPAIDAAPTLAQIHADHAEANG